MRILEAQKVQHHGTTPNLTNRIGYCPPCDVGCRTMHRLKQRRKFALGIEVGTGCNGDSASACWPEVTQDVTKQIATHYHVKKVWPLDKVRRENVNVEFVHFDVRVGFGHLGHPLIPIRHGDGNAIGFGGAGEVFFGPRLRQLEGKFQHPVHTHA